MRRYLAFCRLFVGLVLGVALASCAPPGDQATSTADPSETTRTISPTVEDVVREKMRELNIPGVSLAIVSDGEISQLETFGFADVEAGLPVAEETIFEAASLSKSIFGHFVMTYVEDGRLDLDRPLFTYMPHPDLPDSEWHRGITARMVLSHRSGLPNWRENEPDKELKIKFQPGSGFEYSGEGYQYLAMVLRQIEETDWAGLDERFQARIAGPAGLKNMRFVQTDFTREHRAEPYDDAGNRIDWRENYWYKKDDGVFVAASSVHTTAADFARWMMAVMDGKVLSPASYEALFSNQSDLSSEDQQLHYGLGFAVSPGPTGQLVFHSGSNDGFTSWYLMDPGRKWGYIVLTNSESGVELGEALLEYFQKG